MKNNEIFKILSTLVLPPFFMVTASLEAKNSDHIKSKTPMGFFMSAESLEDPAGNCTTVLIKLTPQINDQADNIPSNWKMADGFAELAEPSFEVTLSPFPSHNDRATTDSNRYELSPLESSVGGLFRPFKN